MGLLPNVKTREAEREEERDMQRGLKVRARSMGLLPKGSGAGLDVTFAPQPGSRPLRTAWGQVAFAVGGGSKDSGAEIQAST